MRRAVVLVLVLLAGGAPAGPAAADEGPWAWPVVGEPQVVRDFDPPTARYAAGHRGVDLAATPGSTVLAAGAGQVTYAGLLAGRGVVVVAHGRLRTTYEPVTPAVAVGEQVETGQPLGVVEAGHLGCAGSACLHWGLRRGEDYLDPVRLVERGPVRLLPVDGTGVAGVPGGGAADGRAADGGAADGAGSGAAVELPPPDPEPEARFSLRAAEAPLGAAAVAALVVGIGLLARPRPVPPAPISGGVAAAVVPVVDEPAGPVAALLDLDAERLRRRSG